MRAGHSVTVLTAIPDYPQEKVFTGYRPLLRRESREGVSVIRVPIYPAQRTRLLPRLANYFSFVASSAAMGSVLLQRPDYLFVESPPLFSGTERLLAQPVEGHTDGL